LSIKALKFDIEKINRYIYYIYLMVIYSYYIKVRCLLMAKISNERKVTYYIGMGMVIIGFILFISVFFSIFSFMKEPSLNDSVMIGPHMGEGSSAPSFGNSIIGMIFMIVGSIVMNIGKKGAAGSGVILDPEKQREDLKPFNEAKGEMINDVISNIDVIDSLTKSHEHQESHEPYVQKEIIKVRCRSCGSLNDEDAKYCKECGSLL
jgi:ribosomal protein L40E